MGSIQRMEQVKKLGQLLVETGHITGEQLIRAIQSQRAVGGRLGTCLLEMDVLSEEQLLEALSGQLRVPAIRIEQLRGIDDETLELIPEKVARRCCAVPFQADRHEIQVATLDVHNLAHLDELRFCSNRRVRPHIANEVRVFEALEKYYGHELPRRYGHLLDRLNRSRYLWDESVKVLLDEDDRAAPIDPMPLAAEVRGGATERSDRRRTGIAGLDDERGDSAVRWASADEVFGDLLITAPSGSSAPQAAAERASAAPAGAAAVPTSGARPVPVASPPAETAVETGPLTLEAVDDHLSRADDLAGVGDVLMRFAQPSFERVALFKVRDGAIEGWRLDGVEPNGGDPNAGSPNAGSPNAGSPNAGNSNSDAAERFRSYRIDQRMPSAFHQLENGRPLRGPLAPLPAHQSLVECWGGTLPRDALLLPIRVRDRTVLVLYGERGDAEADELDVGLFSRVAHKASMALELCILRKKIRRA